MKLKPSVCLKILLTRNKQSLGAYKDLQFCRLERAPDSSSMWFLWLSEMFTQKKSRVESWETEVP